MPNDPTRTSAADPRPPEDHPDHDDWLLRWLGRELSAYELAVPGVLADQTILNNESGLKNPGLKTLAVHRRLLGTTLQKMMRHSEEAL